MYSSLPEQKSNALVNGGRFKNISTHRLFTDGIKNEKLSPQDLPTQYFQKGNKESIFTAITLSLAAIAAVMTSFIAAIRCRFLSPGVFGDDTFTTR